SRALRTEPARARRPRVPSGGPARRRPQGARTRARRAGPARRTRRAGTRGASALRRGAPARRLDREATARGGLRHPERKESTDRGARWSASGLRTWNRMPAVSALPIVTVLAGAGSLGETVHGAPVAAVRSAPLSLSISSPCLTSGHFVPVGDAPRARSPLPITPVRTPHSDPHTRTSIDANHPLRRDRPPLLDLLPGRCRACAAAPAGHGLPRHAGVLGRRRV